MTDRVARLSEQLRKPVTDEMEARLAPLLEEAVQVLYRVADLAEEVGDAEMAELALVSIVKLRRTARSLSGGDAPPQ